MTSSKSNSTRPTPSEDSLDATAIAIRSLVALRPPHGEAFTLKLMQDLRIEMAKIALPNQVLLGSPNQIKALKTFLGDHCVFEKRRKKNEK